MATVILEPKKRKSVTVSTFFPSICQEEMGLDAMMVKLIEAYKQSSGYKASEALLYLEEVPASQRKIKNSVLFWQLPESLITSNPENNITF